MPLGSAGLEPKRPHWRRTSMAATGKAAATYANPPNLVASAVPPSTAAAYRKRLWPVSPNCQIAMVVGMAVAIWQFGIQKAPLARVAELPDRHGHANHHGGQEVLYEQRAGNQLHERSTRKQGQNYESDGRAYEAAHGAIKQRLHQQ